MGILICGLNGAGKSSIGRMLAGRISYQFIDNEDLFFPKKDSSYEFSGSRSKEEVIRLLENMIEKNDQFIFAAVKGDYGEKLLSKLDLIVLIEVPRAVRLQRVYDRSFQKFGERILEGGDLYEREKSWFSLAENRSEDYTEKWLSNVLCPVIRIDGTKALDENVEYLAKVIQQSVH